MGEEVRTSPCGERRARSVRPLLAEALESFSAVCCCTLACSAALVLPVSRTVQPASRGQPDFGSSLDALCCYLQGRSSFRKCLQSASQKTVAATEKCLGRRGWTRRRGGRAARSPSFSPPRARHVLRRCCRHPFSSAAHHPPLDPRCPRDVGPLWSVDPARRLAAPSRPRPAAAAALARRQPRRREQGPVERDPEQAHEERRRGLGRRQPREHADGRRRGGSVAAAAAGQGHQPAPRQGRELRHCRAQGLARRGPGGHRRQRCVRLSLLLAAAPS